MDSTQEIIRGYLDGGKYLKSVDLSDSEDELDIDLLVDPLDEAPDFENHPVILPSPQTPYKSPLKAHLEKLRGSPVKTTRPPLKAREEIIDQSFFSKYDEDELIDTHKYVNKFPDYISSSKEFEKYSLLLASSTDKLMKQLSVERRKNNDLESKLANYENERFQAQVTKGDYDLLKQQFAGLQEKNNQMLRKYRQHEDDNDRLTRENLLLREKLIKYKKLYEDLRDTPSVDKHSPGQFGAGSLNKHPLRSTSQETHHPRASDDIKINESRLSPKNEIDLVDVQTSLHLLAQLLAQARKDSSAQIQVEPPAAAPAAIEEMPPYQQHQYYQALNGVVQSLERIEEDLKQINSTLRQEHAWVSENDNRVDQDRVSSDASTLQQDVGSKYRRKIREQNENVFHETSDLPNPSLDSRCQRHGQPTSSCSACVKAFNKVSRPTSHSTTKDDLQPEGNTQALMGRYMWNKTI